MRHFQFDIATPGSGRAISVEVEADTMREAIIKAESDGSGRVSRGSSVEVDPNLRTLAEVFPGKF